MPTTPPETGLEPPRPAPDTPPRPDAVNPDAPLTFVPHEATGAVSGQPVKIRTGRYGELDAHELVRLLDSIEDERARGRFRESIYISLFFYLALAWLVFYGPRVLWHAPKIKLASDVLHDRELMTLNAPITLKAPRVPQPRPTVDTKTLQHLRETERRPTPTPTPAPVARPQPPQPQPAPAIASTPRPALPPPTPQPVPSRTATTSVPDAPTPQPSARPSFNNPTAGAPSSLSRSGGSNIANVAPIRGGGSAGSGSEILSDTEGVDFTSWKRRFDRGTIDTWLPLLPEEIQPPLMKKGETYILLTVLPDGSIGDMKLENSSHDEALNRAAWGSLTSQGKLPALPSAFHGPNIVLRLHYMVNEDR